MTCRPSVGVGLWNMRSTARRPRAHTALYRELLSDARLVDELGFDSLWLGEHRFWYDGWCPQPVLAASAILAATSRLRVGTSIHLLPQHDPARAARTAVTVAGLFPGRLELGVGLGYRAAELEALGFAPGERGALLATGLDALAHAGYSGPLRIGGRTAHTARRAVERQSGVILPPGLTRQQLAAFLSELRAQAGSAGCAVPPVGLLCDVWVDDDGDVARARSETLLRSRYEEYARAWWGRSPDGRPDERKIAAQVERAVATSVAGTPDEVGASLLDLVRLGFDLVVLQSITEELDEGERHRQLSLQAGRLLPLLRGDAG